MFSASRNLALAVLAVVQVGWPLAQEQDHDSRSSTRSRLSVRVRDSTPKQRIDELPSESENEEYFQLPPVAKHKGAESASLAQTLEAQWADDSGIPTRSQ